MVELKRSQITLCLKHIPLVVIILVLYPGLIHGQITPFKKYVNPSYKFSFDIPPYWAIKYDKDVQELTCVPLTKAQKEIYADCFDGIVFYILINKEPLDSVLENDGSYTKVGNIYYTSDLESDSVKTKNIKGQNWTGIFHTNACRLHCKEDGVTPLVEGCQFIFFSNETTTVCITTTGKEIDEKILMRIINSFRFN